MEELKQALKNNYEGNEELYAHIRNKVKHFGNGDKCQNDIAKSVADMVTDIFSTMTTVRGARIITGAFSYRDHVYQGRHTAASPDGRRFGAPLNDGSAPVQGYDTNGPTISLASTSSWEPQRFLGGISVNVKINTGVSANKLSSFIKGFLKTNCPQIQFNIVDKKNTYRCTG